MGIWGTNFIPDGFANFCFKKSFIPKLSFFQFIDACGNGYMRNIVTTSLFMTLVIVELTRMVTKTMFSLHQRKEPVT